MYKLQSNYSKVFIIINYFLHIQKYSVITVNVLIITIIILFSFSVIVLSLCIQLLWHKISFVRQFYQKRQWIRKKNKILDMNNSVR